ncbi:MAG: ankyrin repeat domain-containing protein [Verrucomicrobia bacterium]|nr:ankyrin repeat domain-containing protein [Verrucomicrobiota bacterium]
MTHYNLSNNPSLIFSSQQPAVIPPQDLPAPPPIPNELHLIEAVEHNNATAVQYLLLEVAEPTARRNAYLLAYQLGHIDIALILLKAGAPLIGSLETLAYNAINQGKYNSVSFDNLSAYIREHGLSFNLNNKHGPKQESLQECAARIGSHLALAWLDQFLISTEGAVYDNEFSDQNDFQLPSLGLPDQADSIGNNNDPWNFLIGFEGFEQAPALSEDPTLSPSPVDFHFGQPLLSDIPINSAPLPSSSVQSLNGSSNGIPAYFIDLTLTDDTPELPFLSLDRIRATQEIDHFNSQWVEAIKQTNCDNLLSLLQQAKQKRIPFDINVKNHIGYTALHVACWKNNSKLARLLIDAGASIEAKNNNTNQTPLDVASTPEIRELLENARTALQSSLLPQPSQQEIIQFNHNWLAALSEQNCNKLLSLLQQARQNNIPCNLNVKYIAGLSALHMACLHGHSQLVKLLIESKADLNVTDNLKDTPLHAACMHGHLEAAKLLIAAGADIHAKGGQGCTPLHNACREGHLQVVRFLIQEKSNVNALTNLRNSPLHLASRNGHFDIIKLLFGEGANIYIKNKRGKTPLNVARKPEIRQFLQNVLTAPQTSFQTPPSQQELHEFNLRWLKAIKESNCNDLVSLLQQAKQKRLPFNINVKINTEYTALHVACWENNLELARLLIEAKASVKVRNKDGHSPLHLACMHGNAELVGLLIEAKAGINDKNITGDTPLHLSSSFGHSNVVKWLIDAGALIEALDNKSRTPLDVASTPEIRELLEAARAAQQASLQPPPSQQEIDHFNTEWIESVSNHDWTKLFSLLEKAKQKNIPFNIDAMDKFERTALRQACIYGPSDLVKLLIDAKASINLPDAEGLTPLHHACSNKGGSEVARHLINAKASEDLSDAGWITSLYIDAQDSAKRTALHYACLCGDSDSVKLLIDAKANIHAKNQWGQTPFYLACFNGHSDVVKQLIAAKANINEKYITGTTALHAACLNGYPDVVRQLLAAGASLDTKNVNGKTPLQVAKPIVIRRLREDALKVQQASLQQEIDQLNKDWSSALSERHCTKLLSLLQQARQKNILLNVDAKMPYFLTTPLHLACGSGDSELVRLLIEAKANINDQDKDGDTPLHGACQSGHLQVAELLIKVGADISIKGEYGYTPLHDASYRGYSEIVRLLINAKADVNDLTTNGYSPLYLACSSGHSDIVKQLLAAGAIIDGKNKEGKTPFQVAKTPEIRQLLEAARLNANSRMDAPFQSRTPHARKLESAGKQLLKRVAEHYGPRYHTALTELLIKNRGRWGIDFARYSSRRIDKREWLAPFVQFLEAHPGSKTASQVVKQQLAFFQFSDSSGNETLTDNLSSAERFVEECLRENVQPPRGGQVPLSDYFAKEACQTLFSLKLREWNYMVNHPERYFQGSERREDASTPRCPCFILAQDKNQVRAHIMQAHFGAIGFIESFGKDVGQEALRFLFTEVLKYSRVPSGRIREDESVILSWQEYNALERYLAELPPSALPRLLVPMREKLIQPIEELSETDSSGDDTESASDEETSYQRGTNREDRPAKRRERSPDESPEQDSLPGSFSTFHDLTGSRSSEKRTTRGNESVSSTKRHRKNAFEAPEHHGAFVPLEEQLNPFPLDAHSKRRRRGNEGEIPEVNGFAGMPLLDDDRGMVFSDNPYDTLNRTSIKKIKEAVVREVTRESVVLRQIKPYSYPIVDKLNSLPAAKPAFSWTRSLKPYQEESLQELLRYDSHGLSKLLSLEMGLGKTYVFAEFLIDKIATSPSPQLHVVSAPVGVVGQVQQEISKLLLEASITAWQLTGKRPSSPQLWPQCRQLLDYANKHPDALKSVLRVLPYFKDAHVYGIPASSQFFSMPELRGQLSSLIKEHLDEIDNLLIERPEERKLLEEQLDAIYTDFTLPIRSNEELLHYFTTRQPLERLCNIAGRILDLYPGRKQLGEPIPIRSDQELCTLRNLGLSPSQITKEQFINAWTAKKSDPELKSLSAIPRAPKICLIGLNDLYKVRDQFSQKHVGALIIDEANRAQNSLLVTSRQLRETIASFRESAFENSDSNNVLLVTGTPFENNLNELWSLLELANESSLLPRTTCNSLVKDTLLATIRQMINLCGKSSKANKELIEQYVLISFAQFMALRNMVQKMVHRKNTSDPQVIEDWKGRIPSKTIRKIIYELNPQMRDLLNEVQEGKRGLSERSLQTQILIHPELAGQSLETQEINGWPFLESFRTGSNAHKKAWIKSSPYLSAVLTDAVFQTSMRNNQKRIIFCDRNALGSAFKETIEHFYQNAKVIIYNGNLKREERDKAIAEFKNESSDHPTVLIAMIKAGGVGLNLAEAHGRHICATQWNEGQKRQADARLIRANNIGEKDMPEIEFPGTYYSAHPKAVRKKKRNWENFLWNTSDSAKDLFRSWTSVLKAETLQVLLNTTIEDGNRRNTDIAKAKNVQISDLLDRFCDSISEDRLNRAISLAMGPSSRAGIEQSPSPTELSDDIPSASSDEERTPSPSEISDDATLTPAVLMNAPVGLGNKSNNCWCNALLQMVASTPSLRACYESFARHYIPQSDASSSGFAASSSGSQRSYLDEYYGQILLSALNLYDQSQEALSSNISQNVREALHHFSSGAISLNSSHNEDAYEALSILLQGSDASSPLFTPLSTIRTYSPLPGLPALPNPTKLANNEYSKLEVGNRSTMTTAVPEILLPLQSNEEQSFSSLLRQFFDSPALPDTPPATYLKGHGLFKYQLQRIQNQFQSVPNEFLLQLGRFRKEGPLDDPILRKMNIAVAVPLTLTLPPEAIASSIETPPSYHLDSFIVHTGELEGGHYFTYKKLEGQWWLCNDSHVEPVALQEIEGILNGGMTTYLHHYTKQA